MRKTSFVALALLLAASFLGVLSTQLGGEEKQGSLAAKADAAARPYGIAARTPWTTSRVTGSPDPPPPYRVGRAFPKLVFKNPLLLARPPVGNRLFVGEQAGKIYSFPNDQSVEKADLFFDLPAELKSWDADKVKFSAFYALAFHPQFAKNRYCYVCYVIDGKKSGEDLPDGTRVSRFQVTDTDPPRVDVTSEKVLITWLGGGHNGCDLHFGPDGFLYISTGDGAGPNPPDKLNTGQDLSDLLSSILRIDVDREDKDRAYAVPPDNPFVNLENTRPEIWAYGFRNPWRMSFDRATGDLWVGDVGWELWEMVYRIQRGGNYGWSVMEGRQMVKAEGKRGPTPILPPAIEFSHTEAASITGGYVYRGRRLKDLVGAYVCGDWQTGRMWATRFDGDRITAHKEIAQAPLRIVAFGEDADGELYFLHHHEQEGTIHRLEPNDAPDTSARFPRKLSETGLFASAKEHVPAPGVVPFSVNAEQWADHATAERFIALPGRSSVQWHDQPVRVPPWFTTTTVFPKEAVLAKTFALEMERGNPSSRRRVETQVLHFNGEEWRGYTYAWNDEQTDAALVPATGADRTLTVVDDRAPGGKRNQKWHFPGRAECIQCHNIWTNHVISFTRPQLDRPHDYGGTRDDQVRTLRHIDVIQYVYGDGRKNRPVLDKPPARLVNPHDPSADLDDRARSYLHTNCAHCHQFGAGGTALIDLRRETALERMNALGVRPVQGTFEIHNAQVLAPGEPHRSVLFYRMSKLGGGRMPHIGSEIVDERGVRLIHDWIRQLAVRKDDRALVEELAYLDEAGALAREQLEAGDRLQHLAQVAAKAAGRPTATEEDRQKAEGQMQSEAAARAKARAARRTEIITRLLATTAGALQLSDAIGEKRIPDAVRSQVLAVATARPEPQVRDLFERYIPDDQRVKRLGSAIRPEHILGLKGDAARGKELFFKTAGLQCVNCHRVNGTGSTLGPDLTDVGKKFSRTQLLESILEPSKNVDPKYVAHLVETTDGQVHTGLLASRTESEIVLKTAGDKEVRLPAGKVQTLVPQKNSLMPDLLLRDLTAEQAADLLEFLTTLK